MDRPVRPVVDEERLLLAARGGDLESFNDLILAYQGQVYALAYRLLGETEGASDVVQDTFLAAFQHIGTFRRGSLRAWLLRIAANLCYDALRRQRSRPSSSLAVLFPNSDPAAVQRSGNSGDDPEAELERQELVAEIQRALDSLPAEQRLAVVLCDIEEFPYAEAARALGISLGTLKSRLSRGRARLREHFFDRRELLSGALRSTLERLVSQETSATAGQDGNRPDEAGR